MDKKLKKNVRVPKNSEKHIGKLMKIHAIYRMMKVDASYETFFSPFPFCRFTEILLEHFFKFLAQKK